MPPETPPDAPASLSTPSLPLAELTSPAEDPLPDCPGTDVAIAEKIEATELEDISDVIETKVVFVANGGIVGLCAALFCKKRKPS